MRGPRGGEQVIDVRLPIGDGDDLRCGLELRLRGCEGGEPALTFFVCRLALMAGVLLADSSGVADPDLLMEYPSGRPSGVTARTECMCKPCW